jgi:hypoxanthine phosphoribosyltransferase
MSGVDHILEVQATAERVFSHEEVEDAISRVATAISGAIAGRNPIIITVLSGGVVFCGKLLTQLDFPLQLDSISVSRYRGETQGGQLVWRLKPSTPLSGRVVVLVDDVLDEGHTLAELKAHCHQEGAQEVFLAVLIDKKLPRTKPCQADFVGLVADDRYLFGYGMDYHNYLRNADGIYACTHL